MMQLFLNSYGCVKCQTRHFEQIGEDYQNHLLHQSKHGITRESFLQADGWQHISTGNLKKGDRSWNQATKSFDLIKLDGNVFAEQCHFVIRKSGENIDAK